MQRVEQMASETRKGAHLEAGGQRDVVEAFGFRVVFFDPNLPNGVELGLGIQRAPTLEALLEQTDTLSIHVPLTPETRGLIDDRALSLLPKGAVLVNTARGPIVDIDAVAKHLKSGH